MIELCYVSSANERYKSKDLVQLLTQVRAKNQRLGITGLLLYDGTGTFIQALEGDNKIIESLFDVIKADSRHKRVNLLGIHEIHERSFGGWSMGFRSLDHPEITSLNGFSEFLNVSPDTFNQKVQTESGFALRMLSYFRQQALAETEDKHDI
ncbi:BLUF domain-containing protein [Pseudomonas sp. SL4(2022)]|uniref:BLUF domain-containing protein n=1 Tax=Pseudomonas sp. SL4(2022) TaxID=2994661 RepID=UPI00226EA6E4|nr:BLUF domain-containing protein [Pseudomonas sp. SL4(2022)]WAC44537.1 BLUF domain-containing protein [Pseudomonas sp. SL4(2022)]